MANLVLFVVLKYLDDNFRWVYIIVHKFYKETFVMTKG